MLKTVFFGTPMPAVPFLEQLHRKTKIAAVITSPDQPAGRRYEMKASAVKIAAEKLSLPVFQPQTLKDAAVAERIGFFGADIGVVVAYGKLLPKNILSIPKHGFLNVHFSLLPQYRGAAPVQWALIHGETETGVTLFWLDEGMDTGPIFLQKKIAIQPEDDADSLRNKLVAAGVASLVEAMMLIETNRITRRPQVGTPSKAPILKKEDGRIDWAKPAETIWNQLRGMTPWPGAFTEGLKILKAKPVYEQGKMGPGTITRLVSGEGPIVECGHNSLALLHVQPESKKPMSAWNWWQGARLKPGDKIR